MAKQIKDIGDVLVVKASGELTPGEIVEKLEDGLIDVRIMHQGESMLITNSPNDPTGKRHDSWHVPAGK